MFAVGQNKLIFRCIVAPEHFPGTFIGELSGGFQCPIKRFYLRFLAEIGDKIAGGIIVSLQPVNHSIRAFALPRAREIAADRDCDHEPVQPKGYFEPAQD
jgi:hypothetical protein